MEARNLRKERTGVVVSNKMDKTITCLLYTSRWSQEKIQTYPTDAKLHKKIVRKVLSVVKSLGLPLRQGCIGEEGNQQASYDDGMSHSPFLPQFSFSLSSPFPLLGQITQELGFQNPQYFSRLFKKVTGCSPNDFRVPN